MSAKTKALAKRAVTPARMAAARRAACLLSAILDVPAPHFFRKTRGARQESFARQMWAYLQHTAFGDSQNIVGAVIKRDRSTVQHASFLIEDTRSGEVSLEGGETLSIEALRVLAEQALHEQMQSLIGAKVEHVEARRCAALVSAIYDIGFTRLLRGKHPDEAHGRHMLVAMLRSSVLGRRQMEKLADLSPKYADFGAAEIARLSKEPNKARVFQEIRALWARTKQARLDFEALALSPKGALLDLWLDDVACIMADCRDLGAVIDAEVRRGIRAHSKPTTEASPPLAA